MNITDIIALSKAGYKKKDIDELLKLEVPEPEEKAPVEPEQIDNTDIENGPKEGAEDVPAGVDNTGNVEINKQIEAANQKIAELEKKLAAAQAVNISKNNDNGRNETADRNSRIADYVRNRI